MFAPDSLARDLDGQFRAGDEDAVRAAWEHWSGLVHRLCRRSLSAADADDVTQQVFIEAWRKRDRYDPSRGPLPAWLLGIARLRVLDQLRRPRAEPVGTDIAGGSGERATADDVDALADRLLVADALARLPDTQRRVLELAYHQDLGHRDIAGQLGLPVGTVKSHLARGLARLRVGLELSRGASEPASAGPAGTG